MRGNALKRNIPADRAKEQAIRAIEITHAIETFVIEREIAKAALKKANRRLLELRTEFVKITK